MEALEEAIVQQEALEITAVWQCLDMLKAAALTAQQGRAVESEAETVYQINKGCATQNNYGLPS